MAVQTTDTLVEQAPGKAQMDEEMKRGIAASEAGDKVTAEQIFRDIVTQDPQAVEAWVWLGWTCASLDDAEAAFRRASEIEPGNGEAKLGLRWVLSQRSPESANGAQPPRSYKTTQLEPLSITDSLAQGTGSLPTAPTGTGVLEAAGLDAVRHVSLEEGLQMGMDAIEAGDRGRAHAIFRELTVRFPTEATTWVWLGGTSPSLEAAELAFRRASEVDPDSEEAQLGLRWVALRRQVLAIMNSAPLVDLSDMSGPLASGPLGSGPLMSGPLSSTPPANAPETTPAAAPTPRPAAPREEKLSPFARFLRKMGLSFTALLLVIVVVAAFAGVATWLLLNM